MALTIGARRRLVVVMADGILKRTLPAFILEAHDVRMPESWDTEVLVRVLWACTNAKLLEIGEDLWPPPWAKKGDPPVPILRELDDAVRLRASPAQILDPRNTRALAQLIPESDHLMLTLRSEVDAGAADDPAEWEVEARILELFVSPSAQRIVLVLDLAESKGAELTDDELAQTQEDVRVEASIIRRVADAVSEPRVVGLVNTLLNILRLAGVGG